MLDRYTHVILLNAPYVGGRYLTAKQGILTEILKVTSAKRITVQVHTGSKQYIDTVLMDLLAHGGGKLLHKFGIPCAGQYGAYRETGAVVGLAVTLTGGIDSQSGGAVGQNGLRYSQTGNGLCGTGSSGYICNIRCCHGSGAHASPSATGNQGGFLLQGHGLEHLINIVCTQFGLCPRHSTAYHGCGGQ